MEIVYKYLGMIIFCIVASFGMLISLLWLVKYSIDFLHKNYKPLWWFAEYCAKRNEFKDYMKDKKKKNEKDNHTITVNYKPYSFSTIVSGRCNTSTI